MLHPGFSRSLAFPHFRSWKTILVFLALRRANATHFLSSLKLFGKTILVDKMLDVLLGSLVGLIHEILVVDLVAIHSGRLRVKGRGPLSSRSLIFEVPSKLLLCLVFIDTLKVLNSTELNIILNTKQSKYCPLLFVVFH